MTIDPGRVARALSLEVERIPDGRVLVTSDHGGRVVDLGADPGERCLCEDATFNHPPLCKHEIAAELLEVRPEILDALRLMIPPVDRRRRVA